MKFRSELEMFAFMEREFYSGAISDILDEMGFREVRGQPARPHPAALPPGRLRRPRPDAAQRAHAHRPRGPVQAGHRPDGQPRAGRGRGGDGVKPLETGIMGELSATAMRGRGARGCLVDGYTRDARKIVRMRFPVFAKGISPIDTTDRAAVVDDRLSRSSSPAAASPRARSCSPTSTASSSSPRKSRRRPSRRRSAGSGRNRRSARPWGPGRRSGRSGTSTMSCERGALPMTKKIAAALILLAVAGLGSAPPRGAPSSLLPTRRISSPGSSTPGLPIRSGRTPRSTRTSGRTRSSPAIRTSRSSSGSHRTRPSRTMPAPRRSSTPGSGRARRSA